ncbi:hypothetical protein M501DRAFT_906601, partial [Patellaria atrata CBS 101060]
KPMASYPVTKDLLKYLWIFDTFEYVHPRCRIQLHFIILLLSDLGLRPGELIESRCWLESNEGLYYKDITLTK